MIFKKIYFLKKIKYTIFIFVFIISSCSQKIHHPEKTFILESTKNTTPTVEREFRAVWIASVANINWPSKHSLSSDQQKKEAIDLLNLLQKNNFNTVILQVRPQADALYQSDIEPWSYFLTGTQGKAPSPYYDPLEFWIKETHKRGLEFHAWLNPYRAHHTSGGKVTEESFVSKNSKLAVKLETGYWWLDPGNKKTQDHSYNVVMDIVKRYNIDGIHFDDYFYPYPSYNNNKDFPDNESWKAYLASGGNLKRDDWRRENVNQLIKRIYTNIKKIKPNVKFGISPFGFWRPNYPSSVTTGFDQYNELYADAKLWLNEGWIDYFTPQLYWPISRTDVSFPVLLNWWNQENTKKRHLWPGMSIGRKKGKEGIDEVINQIMITRGMTSKSPGTVHWSIAHLVNSPELVKAISDGPYKKQALVPKSPWLNNSTPEKPILKHTTNKDSLSLTWTHKNNDEIANWVLYSKYNSQWKYTIYGNSTTTKNIPLIIKDSKKKLNTVALSAIDKYGNESIIKEIPIK